jgi:hypothetical protein
MTQQSRKVAARWLARKASLESRVKDLFFPFKDSIKNWPGFIGELDSLFSIFTEYAGVKAVSVKQTKTGLETAFGKEVGGSEPPSYVEQEFQVPEEIRVDLLAVVDFRNLVWGWSKALKTYVLDEKTFRTLFFDRMLNDNYFRQEFLKLAGIALEKDLKEQSIEFWAMDAGLDAWIPDNTEASVSKWDGNLKSVEVGRPTVSRTTAQFPVLAVLDLDVYVEMPD